MSARTPADVIAMSGLGGSADATRARPAPKPFSVSVDWIYYAHGPGAESQQALATELCELADNVHAPATQRSAYVRIPAARADLVREVVDVAGLYSGSTRRMIDEDEKRNARRANDIIKRGREWLRALQETSTPEVKS